ncbi:hypothetical protein [Defluviitalea raffinosedens]|uniref:hypothetical protein n=1 Tax=Defluviitalea raffinosedens TaxID=1450156 RepID=UPI00195A88FC|nr:hypothetical protein [Defluviitalea raffinosedens]MBM7687281.1 biotin synthase-like enzyme [Defluviitalea raffinosedens]
MVFNYEKLSRKEALSILDLPDEKLPELLDVVYEIRKKHKGNIVSVQLLTNARSGNCTENCAYCAQSHESGADIDRYNMVLVY